MAEKKEKSDDMGYNIPVSLSASQTFSVPQTVNAPYNVVFGAGNRVGGDTEVSPTNYNPSTATASAALGGDSNAASSTGGLSQGMSGKKVLIYGGITVAILAIGIVGYVIYKKHH